MKVSSSAVSKSAKIVVTDEGGHEVTLSIFELMLVEVRLKIWVLAVPLATKLLVAPVKCFHYNDRRVFSVEKGQWARDSVDFAFEQCITYVWCACNPDLCYPLAVAQAVVWTPHPAAFSLPAAASSKPSSCTRDLSVTQSKLQLFSKYRAQKTAAARDNTPPQ